MTGQEVLEAISVRRAMIIDIGGNESLRCPWCDHKTSFKEKKCSHCGGKL